MHEREVKLLSRVRLFVTPWTVAYQAPRSTGFSRQESWTGVPLPSPGDLSDPGIEPGSPAFQADALPSEPPGKPCIARKAMHSIVEIPQWHIPQSPGVVPCVNAKLNCDKARISDQ